METPLLEAQKLNNLRLYKIVKAMLLIADEHPIGTIAKLLNVSPRTIFNWISRFLSQRFSWLMEYHYHGRGRKSKLNESQKRRLY